MANLPRPPMDFPTETRKYLDSLVRSIESELNQIDRKYGRNYTLSNVPTTGAKTLDADSSDLDTTRKVLASLIYDLKKVGKITSG